MWNFRVLAGREVLPPDPHFRTQKYKGSIKVKYSKPVFEFLNFKRAFKQKSDPRVRLLWSRRFFRHQYRPNRLMSYIDVIWAYDIKWRIWHQMTYMTSNDIYDINIWHSPIWPILVSKEASRLQQSHQWIGFWLKCSFKIQKFKNMFWIFSLYRSFVF